MSKSEEGRAAETLLSSTDRPLVLNKSALTIPHPTCQLDKDPNRQINDDAPSFPYESISMKLKLFTKHVAIVIQHKIIYFLNVKADSYHSLLNLLFKLRKMCLPMGCCLQFHLKRKAYICTHTLIRSL